MSTSTGYADILSKDLTGLGFREIDPTVPMRIVACTTAPEKRGKTRFAFTAPGPIGAISTDTGTEEIARQFLSRKKILIRTFRSADDLKQAGAGKKDAEGEWKEMRRAYEAIIGNRKFRTLIIDTATEMWELCRLSAFGKLTQVMPHHYVEVNAEFRGLVKAAYERTDLNVIFIHKVKKEYKTNKEGKDSWTGKMERSGFGDLPYLVDVNIQHAFRFKGTVVDGSPIEEDQFCVRVLDSRMEMLSVVGTELTNDMANFGMLGELMFPQTANTNYWK